MVIGGGSMNFGHRKRQIIIIIILLLLLFLLLLLHAYSNDSTNITM
jgi:hypothetical protein